MKRIISALLAIMMLTVCGMTTAEQNIRKMETPADADEFIAVFLGEHPEELEGAWAFSVQMEAALKKMGYQLERRTVAKYRDALDIPSSTVRRKMAH